MHAFADQIRIPGETCQRLQRFNLSKNFQEAMSKAKTCRIRIFFSLSSKWFVAFYIYVIKQIYECDLNIMDV